MLQMEVTYHIKTTKDYAAALIELLIKEGAVVDIENELTELTDGEKMALDKEKELIFANPDYLENWIEVKKELGIK
jgi:hypothetical protein